MDFDCLQNNIGYCNVGGGNGREPNCKMGGCKKRGLIRSWIIKKTEKEAQVVGFAIERLGGGCPTKPAQKDVLVEELLDVNNNGIIARNIKEPVDWMLESQPMEQNVTDNSFWFYLVISALEIAHKA